MLKAVSLVFLLGGIATALAGEQDVPPDQASTAPALDFENKIENSRRTFAAELNAAALSPEERAIRVERWQQDQASLLQQARAVRTAPIRTAADVSSPDTVPAALASLETPNDPIFGDILEIEAGIRDFQNSLAIRKLTPEQRAIQVEQFHQINRHALVELANLKRQVAVQSRAEEIPATPASAAPMPEETARLKAEIDRVMRDLSQVDPETRAQYFETHAATLKAMMENSSLVPAAHSQSPPALNQTDSDHPATRKP